MILTVTMNPAIDKLYLVDGLKPYEVMRVKEVINTAGGKGLNVSRVAAIAGEEVIAAGLIGGKSGELFESLITQRNIRKAFTKTNAETRSCINIWDEATGKSTEFLEPGNPVTEDDVTYFLRDYERQLAEVQVVAVSGSLPQGISPQFYNTLVELAKRAGKKVLVDTSGRTLQEVLAAKPTLIKPNTDEIRQLLQVDISSREELVAAAQKLHEGGIPIVAVSLGKEGVLVVCSEGVYQGSTPDIPVVNTVGSGDSMVAGFAVSMARGLSITECIRFAVAISTANTQTRQTGFFRQEDFTRILPQVGVKKLQ